MSKSVHIPGPTVRRTLDVMRVMAIRAMNHPTQGLQLRRLAEKICRGLVGRDWGSEIAASTYYAMQHLRYIKDPLQIEQVKWPNTLWFRDKQGDCDDHACGLAALVGSIGHYSEFHAVGFVPQETYSHVYAVARDPATHGLLVMDSVAGPRTPDMLRRIRHRMVMPVR